MGGREEARVDGARRLGRRVRVRRRGRGEREHRDEAASTVGYGIDQKKVGNAVIR